MQRSETFIYILRNPSQRLHLTVFLKAFISKGVRYLTVKKSSIEQYTNWYGPDLLCILLQAALFCTMNVNGGCSSPWFPFAFTVQMKNVFLPDVPEMVFLSSIVCLSLSHTDGSVH